MFEVSERHKLDDVALGSVSSTVFKNSVVRVKDVHGGEIGRADTDDDY